MSKKVKYTVKKLSPMAKVIDDYVTEARRKNTFNAFGAADITMPRKKLLSADLVAERFHA